MVWEKRHQLITSPKKENNGLMKTSKTKIEMRTFGYPHCTETDEISQDGDTKKLTTIFISNHC